MKDGFCELLRAHPGHSFVFVIVYFNATGTPVAYQLGS